MRNNVFVFDLDDTLYQEIEFLKSAFREIAAYIDKCNSQLYSMMFSEYVSGNNVFNLLLSKYPSIAMDVLLSLYRNHIPNIQLNDGALELLDFINNEKHTKKAIITDGRSVTQRNKLDSLQIVDCFDCILISEEVGVTKLDPTSFEVIEEKYPNSEYYYIGDNLNKDFLFPNKFGWRTICLRDRGDNIHKQDFSKSECYLPNIVVDNLLDIIEIIK